MTWFRVGGAGVPASLKNGMNAVLNKKFGTSGQNYPPNGWPDDVNLMGPLPVKSASGAIASFSDGADDVPVKSCVVSFTHSGGGGTPQNPISVQGVSGLSVTNHGKNYISTIEQGGIDATNGKEMASNTRVRTGFIRVAPNTQYTCAVNSSNANLVIFHILEYGTASDSNYIGSTNATIATKTFTTGANTNFVRFTSRDTTNANITPTDLANWQLEKGSSASAYSAYTSSVVTDTFGQTIYGGSRDLVTDKASVGYAKKTFDGTENWRTYTNQNGVFLVLSDMKSSLYGDGVCNIFTTAHSASDATSLSMTFGVNNGVIYINRLFDGAISGVTDVASWKTWLTNNTCEVAYELATPTELTGLTPHAIDTLYGDNNFYADTGDTSVEYRADIDLALAALQGSRSLSASLMRSAGPDSEEVSELEENIQNTEEQEGENDER